MAHTDIDTTETREWFDAVDSVLEREGPERLHFLLQSVIDRARRSGVTIPFRADTAYTNTIPPSAEARSPGDQELEWRIRSIIRWNAMAMVLQANRQTSEVGGHIASFASSATLYDVGFNHFFRAPTADQAGDMIFIQGHSAPGIYARAYVEGRLSAAQLHRFRREIGGGGLSSYPHPRLMPDFWQFPTVSMGLGPLMAIYQARFMRYLEHRSLIPSSDRKVWCFLGDGEMDEPESLGAISLAGRERLDNLIFVINCNLQRLDGPVRGNGKIIQELEGGFRGNGWNVIKLIWGRHWDKLFARDSDGLLLQRMAEAVDGEYQSFKASGDGRFVRDNFFGKYPQLREMVSDMSDDDIWRLNRGGHDPYKIYAAYAAATSHVGQPTVILAKTVKGYGMGMAGEGQNITHQQKKMGEDALRAWRDRHRIPIDDDEIVNAPFYKPPEDSREMEYLRERRTALGGWLPARRAAVAALPAPPAKPFEAFYEGSGDREISTTMAFTRMITGLCRDNEIGERIVPIVADEARTFGMEGMFRQFGIYSNVGQLYQPVDHDQLAYYREGKDGQLLQEGITEAGGLGSWIAAGTAYSNHGVQTIPFFIFYSMFGFQRVGDLIWAGADMRSRGFLIGGTSGRTTLAGEGLQHQDGHSHLLASTVPSCVAYDPCYVYELAVIIRDGLRRMYVEQEDVFFYITTMNEAYAHPAMPAGVEAGITRGMYLRRAAEAGAGPRVQLLGSGAILREVEKAADVLAERFGVAADVWSVTSFCELRRDGLACERWNRLHPDQEPRVPFATEQLSGRSGPVIAASDYMATVADQIRGFVPAPYSVLGTDGFGRSDTRASLRRHFEVDAAHVAAAAMSALARGADGGITPAAAAEAIRSLGIQPEQPDPAGC